MSLESLNKYLTFIFLAFKICIRDVYILPINNINEFIVLTTCLTVTSGFSEFLGVWNFLDWRSTTIALCILIISKLCYINRKETYK